MILCSISQIPAKINGENQKNALTQDYGRGVRRKTSLGELEGDREAAGGRDWARPPPCRYELGGLRRLPRRLVEVLESAGRHNLDIGNVSVLVRHPQTHQGSTVIGDLRRQIAAGNSI